MSLIGLDLNATRARAAHGPAQHPAALRLEGEHLELPLALSLEGRHPAVGRAGVALCRRMPPFACLGFLPHLGTPRTWAAGRHRLDAGRALGLVFDCLQRSFGKAQGVAVALPPYLSPDQGALLTQVAEKSRWRVLGSVPAPVAAALAAQEQLPWSGVALVVDVDEHALTWSAVGVGEEARLLESQAAPHLGRGAWLRRLLDGVANRCVRLSRRDPRESAEADQALYDQLEEALRRAPGAPAEVVVQTPQWYQHLTLQPDDLVASCAALVGQALAQTQGFLEATAAQGTVGAVLMTAAAAQLPGLTGALEDRLRPPAVVRAESVDSDFGEDLLLEDRLSAARVHVLEADALARAAHDLAGRLHRGDLPRGHLDAVLLPPGTAAAADTGPARLHFRDRDHLLSGPVFTLGRDPTCDLVFESELYPSVSARHCEIVFDRRHYTLRDRSRHGTLVNDRAVNQQVALNSGDWIRLGPGGPLLRFLGQTPDGRQLMTTA
jgi:hypothetical protein